MNEFRLSPKENWYDRGGESKSSDYTSHYGSLNRSRNKHLWGHYRPTVSFLEPSPSSSTSTLIPENSSKEFSSKTHYHMLPTTSTTHLRDESFV